MESLIVHPKNQMELNALKTVMKDMGIRYEKFHTRNTKSETGTPLRGEAKKAEKLPKKFKDKPKPGL